MSIGQINLFAAGVPQSVKNANISSSALVYGPRSSTGSSDDFTIKKVSNKNSQSLLS